jgi:hypothetical protein
MSMANAWKGWNSADSPCVGRRLLQLEYRVDEGGDSLAAPDGAGLVRVRSVVGETLVVVDAEAERSPHVEAGNVIERRRVDHGVGVFPQICAAGIRVVSLSCS